MEVPQQAPCVSRLPVVFVDRAGCFRVEASSQGRARLALYLTSSGQEYRAIRALSALGCDCSSGKIAFRGDQTKTYQTTIASNATAVIMELGRMAKYVKLPLKLINSHALRNQQTQPSPRVQHAAPQPSMQMPQMARMQQMQQMQMEQMHALQMQQLQAQQTQQMQLMQPQFAPAASSSGFGLGSASSSASNAPKVKRSRSKVQTVQFVDSDGDPGSFRLLSNKRGKTLQLWYGNAGTGAEECVQPDLSIVVYDPTNGDVAVGSEGSVLGGNFSIQVRRSPCLAVVALLMMRRGRSCSPLRVCRTMWLS